MEDKEIDSVEREDVAKFLERIKEMGARHDREDAERTHKLEAELAASREARRIRRDGMFCGRDRDCDVITTTRSSVTNDINF
jgi:hypothetical protein